MPRREHGGNCAPSVPLSISYSELRLVGDSTGVSDGAAVVAVAENFVLLAHVAHGQARRSNLNPGAAIFTTRIASEKRACACELEWQGLFAVARKALVGGPLTATGRNTRVQIRVVGRGGRPGSCRLIAHIRVNHHIPLD